MFIFYTIICFMIFSPSSLVFANIITSIRPLAFIAAGVVDGIMPIQILLPDGFSPHDYSLKPSDFKKNKTSWFSYLDRAWHGKVFTKAY
ncbi:hypothetical protein [Candidatus Providencia siddallii]|uniref:hypothetical protein n=1 Tax=Candidatus Providencia siddallii TaxID=1715285 RepID=UPI00312C964E